MTERRSHGLRNIGLRARLVFGNQSIEIDELRIVLLGVAVEPRAAMKVHQCLDTPGVEMVHMLMLQRCGQQRFG